MTALTFARFGGVVCAAQPRKGAKAKLGRVSASGNGASIADLARENGASNGALSSNHTESFPESSDKGKGPSMTSREAWRIDSFAHGCWPRALANATLNAGMLQSLTRIRNHPFHGSTISQSLGGPREYLQLWAHT